MKNEEDQSTVTDHHPSEESILEQALTFQSTEARLAYLQGACGQDQALRSRVESLIEAHQQAGRFLEDKTTPARRGASPEPSPEEKPGTVIGRYKLRERIGEGGCGVVYVAEQEEPVRRRVALKVIKLGMDTRQVVARFEAERQALAMMDHSNIAKVLDAGATESGRPYFVMELVRGIKITDYCDQNQLSTGQRLELFMQVCRAVQHAHQKGIIHRDLKPSNILVTLHDGLPVPKVIDFGIAKATEDRLTDLTIYTELHQFIGTPAYMSPEQAEMSGLDIDTRSDIYSLGVLLYELLTGKTPFDAKELLASGVEAMRRTLREKEPLRPSTRLGTMVAGELTTTAQRRASEAPKLIHLVRGDLDWIVMKALEKDRTRRYETANGFAADIERHLNLEPVVARPPSNLYRFQKMVRRNKLAFVATTAVFASLILGMTGTTWQAVRATRLQKHAVSSEHSAREAQHEAEQEKAEIERLLPQVYSAKMFVAQQAWEQTNLERVRQMLEATGTNSNRGFEWYYWQRQAHLELKTLRGHNAAVCSVAFSPDGRRVVTGSLDKTAKVWESTTGRRPLFTLNHSNAVIAVAFSPDGSRIVTASDDHTAKVWNATNGQPILTFTGHSAQVRAVAYSHDGRWIATGSLDQTAKLWDATTGIEKVTFKADDAVRSVNFSPDGKRIVTTSGTTHPWDVWNSSTDTTARVWEVASGRRLLTLVGHRVSINSAVFSPDGRKILTGSWDNTAKLWDATSGAELRTIAEPNAPILSVAFSPDGERLVTGSVDQTAKVWDATTGEELLVMKGHGACVNSVAFSPDGNRIATGSGDWQAAAEHSAKLWNAVDLRDVLTLKGHTNGAHSLAFSPDGERIVTASGDGRVKIWRATSGELIHALEAHSGGSGTSGFSADGKRILTFGVNDGTAKIWDATSFELMLTLTGQSNGVTSAAFFPDGKRITTGGQNGTVKVWEASSGRELLSLEAQIGRIWSVAISRDAKKLIGSGDDAAAKVWDAESGKELSTFRGHADYVYCAAFSPDGLKVVTGAADQTAKVWDPVTGTERRTFKGHANQIWAVAFSHDGSRILTGSGDQTAKLWDAASGEELLTLKNNPDPVKCVAFSPDDQRIATGGVNGVIKVWHSASPEQVAAWQEEEREANP
jgi:WD40 repeat protein/serine/threonine protein kinase